MNTISVIIEPEGSDVIVANSSYCHQTVIPQNDARRCFSGLAVDIFLLLFEMAGLNFTLFRARHFYPNGSQDDVWKQVQLLLANGTIDFNAGLWMDDLYRQERFYFVRPSVTWRSNDLTVIEKERNYRGVSIKESFKFNNVFALFDVKIWLALLCSVVVLASIIVVSRRKFSELKDLVFELFRIAVFQSDSTRYSPGVEERLVFIWSVAALICCSCFSGLIYMKTTVQPGWVQPFHSLESMRDAGYK